MAIETTDFFRSAALTCATLLTVMATGCAVAPLESPRQEEPRLEGVRNFRDIGGYKTRGGHTIRYRVLYRSADLGDMTASDREKLRALGIRQEIDLRGPGEIAQRPTKWETSQVRVSTPFEELRTRPGQTHSEVYFGIADGQAANIGSVLRQLAAAEGPSLLHCAAGNDRTGLTVAILMKLFDTPQNEITANTYEANEYWTSKAGRKDLQSRTNQSEEKINSWAGLEAKYLEELLQSLDRTYGSFDNYTRNGLKLTAQEISQLRARFLE